MAFGYHALKYDFPSKYATFIFLKAKLVTLSNVFILKIKISLHSNVGLSFGSFKSVCLAGRA